MEALCNILFQTRQKKKKRGPNNVCNKREKDRFKFKLMIIFNVKGLNTETQKQIIRLDIKERAGDLSAETQFKYQGTNRRKVKG